MGPLTFAYSAVDRHIQALPLKRMDPTLLSRAILIGAADAGLNLPMFEHAIALAAYLHRDKTRMQRSDMPRVHYIEHPLRTTLRLLRFGCTDQATLVAEILHDTVEDHAGEIVLEFTSTVASTVAEVRTAALAYLEEVFGPDVAAIVRAMSNPLTPEKLSVEASQQLYRGHVTEAIEDARVALAKASDFIDNAGSLHHTYTPQTAARVTRMAQKYNPLVPVFRARFLRLDIDALLTAPGRARVLDQVGRVQLGLDNILALDSPQETSA
jgi:(p)ppGpp synthase/HD superfamily hydrolase